VAVIAALLWGVTALAVARLLTSVSAESRWRRVSNRCLQVFRTARLAVASGLVAIAFTRWVIVGLLSAIVAWAAPALISDTKRSRERLLGRFEGLAKWLESVADNLKAGAFLFSALVDSAKEAPPPVRLEVDRLASRVNASGPSDLGAALQQFADSFAIAELDEACEAISRGAQGHSRNLSGVVAGSAARIRERVAFERETDSGDRKTIYISMRIAQVMLIGLLLAAAARISMFRPLHTPGGSIALLVIGTTALVLTRSAATLNAPRPDYRPVRVQSRREAAAPVVPLSGKMATGPR
jgi:tight adherence protein B